jgi:protein TonB
VKDAVDEVLAERARMDRGFPGSIGLSIFGHLVLVGGAIAGPLLAPAQPVIRVADGIAVPVGGRGKPAEPAPAPEPAEAPAAQPAPPVTAPPKPEAPKIQKPPKPEQSKKALPLPDSKKTKTKKQRDDDRSATPPAAPRESGKPSPAQGGAPGGKGTSTSPVGLEFAPPGVGVPTGTDPFGDWYIGAVQRKVWNNWLLQAKPGFTVPIGVMFTILADGSVTDVSVIEPSGNRLLDLGAERAILTAAPFGPLPRNYGTDRYTVHATFKPTN